MILHTLSTTFFDLCQGVVTYFPGNMGYLLRRAFWRDRLSYLGKNARIDVGVYFQNPRHITLDDHCWVDRNVVILAGPPSGNRVTYTLNNPIYKGDIGEVFIGQRTHISVNCVLNGIGGLHIGKCSGIAANSTIYSFSHHYRDLSNLYSQRQHAFTSLAPMHQQAMILGPVFIGDYCAIGLNSVVLPGTVLKRGCWIASSSVVRGIHNEQVVIETKNEAKVKSLSHLKLMP